MFAFLEHLRQKPEHERRRAVLWISTSVTIVIFLVWAVALGIRVKAGDFTFKNPTASSTVPNIGDTFSTFWNNVRDSLGSASTTEQ